MAAGRSASAASSWRSTEAERRRSGGAGDRSGTPSRAPSSLAEALTHRSALDRQPDLKAAFPARQRAAGVPRRPRAVARHGRPAAAPLPARARRRAGAAPCRPGAAPRRWSRSPRRSACGAASRLGDSRARQAATSADHPGRRARGAAGRALPRCRLRGGGADHRAAVGRAAEQPHSPRRATPKTQLQEWAQARGLPLPAYREVGREGPPHAPVFVVDVSIKWARAGGAGPRPAPSARPRAPAASGAARTAEPGMIACTRAPASSPSSARPTPASRPWSMRWSARRSASSRPRCRPRACG